MARAIKYRGLTYKLASKMFSPTGKIIEARVTRSKMRTADKTGDRQHSILVQYVDHGNSLNPAGNIRLAPKLHPGVYEILSDMNGYFFERQAMNTDSLLKFEDPIHSEILGEMDNFWKHKEKYEKKGFLHNRAVLMFGPPGSGKSCLIKLAIADLIGKGDVVFTGKNIYSLNGGLKTFREIEPERRCLAVLEDVDEMGEHALREFVASVFIIGQPIKTVLKRLRGNGLEMAPVKTPEKKTISQAWGDEPSRPYEGKMKGGKE